MKKIFLLAMLTIFGIANSNAQQVKKTKKTLAKKTAIAETPKVIASKVIGAKVEGAGMLFENETIDYGTIAHNADGNREFVFTNNGSKPLIITNTQGSCGCTVPTTPKEPIAPGAKGKIGVKYATDRVGAFTKTVTVTSNAEGQATKTLTIKGTVLADEVPAATPTTKS
ncbi:DUF1573 domain-containing protein [Flavobacterium luteum]|uniref:DUF1573 domain-containing protein n=1 Tax=Flavobacterium luteum TaxID=2026654 RepID=A0A7J5AFB8_9FLAO|nr:DUF1573 domain-containing protein [Flavobacterium luteum]KAB1156245.1 DUF1573 domain-containing protein [Flavobacterium luteum]